MKVAKSPAEVDEAIEALKREPVPRRELKHIEATTGEFRGVETNIKGRRVITALCYVIPTTLLLLATFPQPGWCIEASTIANEVRTYQAPQLRLARELQIPGLVGEVSHLFWSSDGSLLAAATIGPSGDLLIIQVPNAFGGQITIWDSAGTLLKQIRRSYAFFDVMDNLAFVEGKKIVAPPSMLSSNLAFSVFDVESGEIVHEVAGSHPDRPRNVNASTNFAVSPDESILAVVFGRALPQPVALYSTRDWSKIGDLADTPKNIVEEPRCLAFSDDGQLLAVGGFGKILIYDVQTRLRVQSIEAFPGSHPDFIRFAEGDTVIIAGARYTYVSRVLRKYIYAFRIEDGAPLASHDSGGTAYDSSHDGRLVAFIERNRRLHLWDRSRPDKDEQIVELGGLSESLKFSPAGNKLAVGVGQKVKVFEVMSLQ